MDEEKRCEAGVTTKPTDCERHPEHYWCRACEGWYGIPHDMRCHTAEVRLHKRIPGMTRPDLNCACRYCRIMRDHGARFANELFGSEESRLT